MTEVLGIDSIGDIAALCRRSIWGAPTEEELRRCLFPDDQETSVVGDPVTGVVCTVREADRGFVRLLVVAPDRRRTGLGRQLLAAAEDTLAGVSSITMGRDPGYSLWPGVPATDLALACLAESAGYRRVGVEVNMEVDLKVRLATDPGGWLVAAPEHATAVSDLCAAHCPGGRGEVMRALAAGTLVVGMQGKSVAVCCAVDANRAGTIGPVVVAPGADAADAVLPALAGAIRLMRQMGQPRAEIVAVGEMRPYAAVGAKVSRLFLVHHKELGSSS